MMNTIVVTYEKNNVGLDREGDVDRPDFLFLQRRKQIVQGKAGGWAPSTWKHTSHSSCDWNREKTRNSGVTERLFRSVLVAKWKAGDNEERSTVLAWIADKDMRYTFFPDATDFWLRRRGRQNRTLLVPHIVGSRWGAYWELALVDQHPLPPESPAIEFLNVRTLA